MGTVKKIIKNTSFLLFSRGIGGLISFIVIVYLARILTTDDFGKINFAMAVIVYFSLISNMGLTLLGTKEIARSKEKISEYLGNVLTLRLGLSIISFTLLFLLVLFLNKSLQVKYLILLYGAAMIPSAFFLDWAFQGLEKMEYIVLGNALTVVIYLVLVVLFIKTPQQLLLVPCFLFVSNFISAGLLFFIFAKNFGKPKFGFNFAAYKEILKTAVPMGLIMLMSQVIYYLDTVMLGFMKSDTEVGYYSAAYKIILLLITAISAYHDAVFPVISGYYKTSMDSLKKLNSVSVKLMIIIAIPLALGGTIIAGPVITFVYGVQYKGGIIALQILIWACALILINTAYSRGLFATDRQNDCLKIVAFQALIVIALNFILIPAFGITGAGAATVSGELIAFILYFAALKNITFISTYNSVLKPLIASGLIMLFFTAAKGWNVLVLISAGTLIYFICLYAINGFSKEDISLVKSVFAKNKQGAGTIG